MKFFEGAFTNEGLYWISPKGQIIPVNVPPYEGAYSHEEYAQVKWGVSLEEALMKKYIRIQSIKGNYLFIDHKQNKIKSSQIEPLETFFYELNGTERNYRQIIVERINNDMREFSGDQIPMALAFAIDGTEGDIAANKQGSQSELLNKLDREKMHPFYANKPFGDSVLSFKNWLSD